MAQEYAASVAQVRLHVWMTKVLRVPLALRAKRQKTGISVLDPPDYLPNPLSSIEISV